jgi:aspartyl-tRNA(Asn)/glutamyl-tRNA(Gln) amidotransferase subunit A
MAELAEAATANPRGAITSVEAYRWHRPLLETKAGEYDPRVLRRIEAGRTITDAEYRALLEARERFIRAIEAAAAGYDAMLMPTTPDAAPTIAEATRDDESYFRLNSRMCRNPSVVNLFDGCALSVPCQEPGSPPVGLMIAGTRNTDRRILAIGRAVEEILKP